MRRLTPWMLATALVAPSVAHADPFRPSMADQVKLGQDEAAKIARTEPLLKDNDPRVIELRAIGDRLVANIPPALMRDKPWKFQFNIIDKNEINAFALPGGPIYFYSGLLNKMKTKDEVAGVLGHEIVHIVNQHWASQYADNMKRRMGLLIVLNIIRAGDTVFDIASVGDALYSLGYSRRHEEESDRIGYDIMVAAGYNPVGMAETFELLASQGNGGAPEFLRTHPDSKRRADNIRKRIAEDSRRLPARQARDARALAAGGTTLPKDGERIPPARRGG
ncbi:MAG: M48 family metalloprotease [Fimbriimonadaceae bacterium]|nr:M48 family metalloprotease [Fimbriimonadaceae bacterium]